MLGVLDTTWDWLHKGFHSIPLASCCCWEEKANYPTINGGLLIEIASQRILRKLMPLREITQMQVYLTTKSTQ